MRIIAKIALRNIILNKRKSVLIGFTLFFSTFILLFSSSAINGIQSQVTNGYVNIQTGDVIVMWKSLKEETAKSDPGRFVNPIETHSFIPSEEVQNERAVQVMETYLVDHQNQVEAAFPTVRRNAKVISPSNNDSLIIYSVSSEAANFLLDSRTMSVKEGEFVTGYGISLSEDMAEELGVRLGDEVNVEVIAVNGDIKYQGFTLTGIYANGAGYNNWFGILAEETARELYGMSNSDFDVTLIHLQDKGSANEFAAQLDQLLLAESDVLRAESYLEASDFYTRMPQLYKSIFTVFIFFLLSIIAVGLRSIVRMNLFQRIKEFGTLRAIGYGRAQNFFIIFLEIFFLSLISLLIALLTSSILVSMLGQSGISVEGDLRDAVGGASFYPIMKVVDIVVAFISITLFSLIATVNPGLRLCYQKISDLMLARQHKISVIALLFKQLFTRKNQSMAYGDHKKLGS